MQESTRFFREVRALRAFVGGVLLLCVGLVSWNDMDKQGRTFWLILTPMAFISALLSYWLSKPKRRRHNQAMAREIERRNPPAKLPPLRDL